MVLDIDVIGRKLVCCPSEPILVVYLWRAHRELYASVCSIKCTRMSKYRVISFCIILFICVGQSVRFLLKSVLLPILTDRRSFNRSFHKCRYVIFSNIKNPWACWFFKICDPFHIDRSVIPFSQICDPPFSHIRDSFSCV